MHPAMDAIVLTPIAPHTLTHRPIVIPAEREVRVRAAAGNAGAEIYVTFDGQHGFPLPDGEEVVVTRCTQVDPAGTRRNPELLRSLARKAEVGRTLMAPSIRPNVTARLDDAGGSNRPASAGHCDCARRASAAKT